MQVVLAALGQNTWQAFVQVSWGFSVATIIFAACPMVMALLGIAWVLIDQAQFAVRMRLREKKSQQQSRTLKVQDKLIRYASLTLYTLRSIRAPPSPASVTLNFRHLGFYDT
jgi:hypothetical protein